MIYLEIANKISELSLMVVSLEFALESNSGVLPAQIDRKLRMLEILIDVNRKETLARLPRDEMLVNALNECARELNIVSKANKSLKF